MFIYHQFVVRGTSNSFMRCRSTGIGSTESYMSTGHCPGEHISNNGQFRIAKFSQMVQVDCCEGHLHNDSPVYFALFAKFSQMRQVDCFWRLGCPKKTLSREAIPVQMSCCFRRREGRGEGSTPF